MPSRVRCPRLHGRSASGTFLTGLTTAAAEDVEAEVPSPSHFDVVSGLLDEEEHSDDGDVSGVAGVSREPAAGVEGAEGVNSFT